MKKSKLLGKRVFVTILIISMLIPACPMTQKQTADAAESNQKSSGTQLNNSESTTELIKEEFGDTIDEADSSINKNQSKNKGKNPLTGNNDRALVVNPSYELMVGTAGIGIGGNQDSLDEGTDTILQQKVYDLEGRSGKKISELSGYSVKEEVERSNVSSSGDALQEVRTVAYDPEGTGKDTWVAEVCALRANGGTLIYLQTFDATKDRAYYEVNWNYCLQTPLAYLKFEIEEWQADAYMQIAAGDFDGDEQDELAVYMPTGEESNNDMAASSVKPVVKILDVNLDLELPEEDRQVTFEDMVADDEGTTESYYYVSAERDSNHDKAVKTNNAITDICAVDLEAIRMPGASHDSLAIATSPASNGAVAKTTNAETQVDIWLDPARKPSKSNLSKHDMRWRLSAYTKGSQDTSEETDKTDFDIMMFGGLSAGDLDGDGTDELLVAGYRIRNTGSGHTNWTLDSRYLYVERLIPSGNGYEASGTVPQILKVDGGAFIHYQETGSPKDQNVMRSPLSVKCYKGKGRDFADVFFANGCVYEWKENYSSSFVRSNKVGTSSGGYAKLTSLSINKKENTTHSGLMAKAKKEGLISFANLSAGNFDNNPYGIEQLYATMQYTNFKRDDKASNKSKKSLGASIVGIGQNVVGEYQPTYTTTVDYKDMKTYADRIVLSLCTPDTDEDSSYVQYTAQEVYYSDPQPIAVMQAPPYHEELESNGNAATCLTITNGTGEEKTEGFNATLGVVVGVEEEFSIFGLGKTGFSTMIEMAAGAGYEHTTHVEKSISTAYELTDENQVIAVTTPYVRYQYDVTTPKFKTKTDSELKALKAEITKLNTTAGKSSGAVKKKIQAQISVLQDYYDNQKELRDTYGAGKTVGNVTLPITYSEPGTPATGAFSVESYNAMVTALGKSDDWLVDEEVLMGAEAGNVASYMWGETEKKSNKRCKDFEDTGTWTTVNNEGAGTVSQKMSKSSDKVNTATWEVGISNETTVSAAGVTAGISTSLQYSGNYGTICSQGLEIEGKVECMPADSSSNYAFTFQMATWKAMIGGSSCQVVGYKTQKDTGKFPPKPVKDITAEAWYDESNVLKGVCVSWYPAELASTVYMTDPDSFKISVKGKTSVIVRDGDSAAYKDNDDVIKFTRKRDAQGKMYYEAKLETTYVPSGTLWSINVQPICKEVVGAATREPALYYSMNNATKRAIFQNGPYVETNTTENSLIDVKAELSYEDLKVTFHKKDVSWQYADETKSGTCHWKDVTSDTSKLIVQSVKANELDDEESMIKAGLTARYTTTAVNAKRRFRVKVAYTVDGSESGEVYEVYSEPVILSDNTLGTVSVLEGDVDESTGLLKVYAGSANRAAEIDMPLKGREQMETLYSEASIKRYNEGNTASQEENSSSSSNGTESLSTNVITVGMNNLTNNAYSQNVLLRTGEENTLQLLPGVYELNIKQLENDVNGIDQKRFVYYGDNDYLLATKAQKVETVEASIETEDVSEMKFGECLKFTTELYRKASDSSENVQDVTYRVVSENGGDVTSECIKNHIFTPNAAGLFTVYVMVTVDEVEVEARKVIRVVPSRYEGEELEQVLDTEFADVTGVVYGTEKTAEALNLPTKARIKTKSGSIYEAGITWNVSACAYDPTEENDQTFTINGVCVIPESIQDNEAVSKDVTVRVTVNEVYSVSGGEEPEIMQSNEAKPTGSIVVGEHLYTDLQEEIAFDTEFETPQEVVITGEDEEEGIETISYIKTDTGMTLAELEASNLWKEWTDGTSLRIENNEQCVIYARIENQIGNVIYLSTSGIIVKVAKETPSPAPSTTPVPSATPLPTATPDNSDATNTSSPAPTTTAMPTLTPDNSGTMATQFPNLPQESAVKETTKQGGVYAVGKGKYQVTSLSKKEVQLVGTKDKKAKTLVVPASVTISGQKFQVTSIKANAFKNNKKLTKVVIGKHITKIGKKAFYGCKKLKNVEIKTKKLKKGSIGMKAFANIAKKPKFKVVVKSYKKLIKASKVTAKAKITK